MVKQVFLVEHTKLLQVCHLLFELRINKQVVVVHTKLGWVDFSAVKEHDIGFILGLLHSLTRDSLLMLVRLDNPKWHKVIIFFGFL